MVYDAGSLNKCDIGWTWKIFGFQKCSC